MSPTHPQPQAVDHSSRPDTRYNTVPRGETAVISTLTPLPVAAAQPAEPREGDTCHVQQKHLVFGVGNFDEKELKNG